MQTRQFLLDDAPLAQAIVPQFHERNVSLPYMETFLGNSANYLLVAEEEDKVVGFLSAHRIDSIEREASAMFIYEIEVAEQFQRKGAGRALIEHIRRLALEGGMFEMFVFTNHSNTTACAFYAAMGGQIEEGDELMFVYPLAPSQE